MEDAEIRCPYCGAAIEPVAGTWCRHYVASSRQSSESTARTLGVEAAWTLGWLAERGRFGRADVEAAPASVGAVLAAALEDPEWWVEVLGVGTAWEVMHHMFVTRPCPLYFLPDDRTEIEGRAALVEARSKASLLWLLRRSLEEGRVMLLHVLLAQRVAEPTDEEVLRAAAEGREGVLEILALRRPEQFVRLLRERRARGEHAIPERLEQALRSVHEERD